MDSLTILDYYNNEPDKTFVGTALDSCADEVGVTIKRETVPGKDLIQKVLQQSSSKTLPDVLMIDNPDVQQIAATGGLSPLSDYDVDTSGFAQGILDAATYEDEVYGLAPTVNTLGLFYNEDVLAAAGIEPPTTWDELKTAAARADDRRSVRRGLLRADTTKAPGSSCRSCGPTVATKPTSRPPRSPRPSSSGSTSSSSGAASKGVINWTQADVNDQFMAGKAAMMVNGPWQIPALKDSDVKWGTVQVPVNKASQTPPSPRSAARCGPFR